ncbi:MAG: aldo/keto reductase [Bacteroidales bacterium]|nr:aldo/keto reductase [Bacteroidales bacterium]
MIEPVYSPSPDRYASMEYRRSGRSGIRIPALALGLWHNFGSHKPFQDVKAMAHYAFDKGICHFDLANNYGPEYGTAEENFGRLMDISFRPYRDELLISTKAGWDMWPGPYGNWGSRKYLMSSLDQSLRRMRLDYVDVFYSHRFDPATPLEETMQALVDIVRQGKALYVGLSRYPTDKAREAYRYLAEHDVPCLLYQDRYNIIDRAPECSGLIDLGEEAGTGFISFSPLQQGLLTNRYLNGVPADSRMAKGVTLREELLTPTMMKALRGLNELAMKRGQSLAQMALAWLLKDSRVTSVIIGASSVPQIEDNLKALENTKFSPEELALIEEFSAPIQLKELPR